MKIRGNFGRGAFLLGLSLSVSVAFAEDFTTSIGSGAKAMLFSFSGLQNLGADAYNGGFGAKYFLTGPIALRGTLIFGMATQNDPTTLSPGGTDGSESASKFGLNIGGEYHLSVNRVSPYVGGEVGFSTKSTKVVAPINVANGPQVTTENSQTAVLGYTPGTGIDIGALGGVEFFITKEISLGAEYRLGIGWTSMPDQKVTTVIGTTTTTNTTKTGTRMDLGIQNSGALTLAVYF
jgi:hypothetical protein